MVFLNKNSIFFFLKILNQRINAKEYKSYSLTIDGSTLACLFEMNLKYKFLEVAVKCKAVLCCRMSPSQKASV